MSTYLEKLQALGYESVEQYEEFLRLDVARKEQERANPTTLIVADGQWCCLMRDTSGHLAGSIGAAA